MSLLYFSAPAIKITFNNMETTGTAFMVGDFLPVKMLWNKDTTRCIAIVDSDREDYVIEIAKINNITVLTLEEAIAEAAEYGYLL